MKYNHSLELSRRRTVLSHSRSNSGTLKCFQICSKLFLVPDFLSRKTVNHISLWHTQLSNDLAPDFREESVRLVGARDRQYCERREHKTRLSFQWKTRGEKVSESVRNCQTRVDKRYWGKMKLPKILTRRLQEGWSLFWVWWGFTRIQVFWTLDNLHSPSWGRLWQPNQR